MKYGVKITTAAAKDITALSEYLLLKAGIAVTLDIIADIEQAISTLDSNPQRGSNLQDILAISPKPRKQILCGVYRILYQIIASTVFVEMVIDSRRNVQQAFVRRLETHL